MSTSAKKLSSNRQGGTLDARRKTQDARRKTQDARRKTAVCLGLVFALNPLGCGSDASMEGLETEILEETENLFPEVPFRHPLLGVELVDGKVPGVDIHTDPETGEQFAVGELTTQLQNSDVVTRSGVVRLNRYPIQSRAKEYEGPPPYALIPFARKPTISADL